MSLLSASQDRRKGLPVRPPREPRRKAIRSRYAALLRLFWRGLSPRERIALVLMVTAFGLAFATI